MLRHRTPPLPAPRGRKQICASLRDPEPVAPSRIRLWSPAHMLLFDRIRGSHFVHSLAAFKPCLAFVSSELERIHNYKGENCLHADWLGYLTPALDCSTAFSATCALPKARKSQQDGPRALHRLSGSCGSSNLDT